MGELGFGQDGALFGKQIGFLKKIIKQEIRKIALAFQRLTIFLHPVKFFVQQLTIVDGAQLQGPLSR